MGRNIKGGLQKRGKPESQCLGLRVIQKLPHRDFQLG